MKKYRFFLVWCVTLMAICVGQTTLGYADTLMVDAFEHGSQQVKSYSGAVRTQDGYGVYYEQATLDLSWAEVSSEDKALRIEFALPPAFSWGNWLSVRRDTSPPLNLAEYAGLEFTVRVEKPASGASLRITLLDLMENGKGGDEMWWFDCDVSLLTDTSQDWITVRLPFRQFYKSHGIGTRHNDYRLNLKKILGYEVNLISAAGKHPAGVIIINSLQAYK